MRIAAPTRRTAPGKDAPARVLAPDEEVALVRRALAGAADALRELAGYLSKVPAIVAVQRQSSFVPVLEQEVPDLVQDCLAVVWRKLPEFEGRASLTTWMFRVCSLEMKNGLRRVARRRRTGATVEPRDFELATTRDDPAARASGLDVEAGLARLDSLHERVVRLHHYEEKTFDEIAAATGMKTSQVKTCYYRALQRMHDWFVSRDFEDAKP